MRILGIIGSPHKEGLTNRLVQSALAGAREGGAETAALYAADFELGYCRACDGRPCWETMECQFGPEVRSVSEQVMAADGLVLAAPVYFWQVNALTACLMDRARLPGRLAVWTAGQGRPALGISMAGGTGTGLVAAVQSLYKYLQIYGFRALDPLPVARYNLEAAVEQARAQGRRLAGMQAEPFADFGESMAYYDSLPFLRMGTLEEVHYLARLIAEHCPARDSNQAARARLAEELATADRLLAGGERTAAARHVHLAYQAGTEAWEG